MTTPPGRVTRAISAAHGRSRGTWASTLNEQVTSKLVVAERDRGDARLAHVEPALARALEHPGGEVDPLGAAREPGEALEQQAGADAALEHVAPGAVALDELDLEVVDERVVAVGAVRAALGLVAVRELVVVGARRRRWRCSRGRGMRADRRPPCGA